MARLHFSLNAAAPPAIAQATAWLDSLMRPQTITRAIEQPVYAGIRVASVSQQVMEWLSAEMLSGIVFTSL